MEILSDEAEPIRRQKLARITLDSMVQFVGLLDAQGTVLEINHVALDAAGISLADVEGKPFWTTFWWQVSEDISRTLRESIARAAQGETVRWDAVPVGAVRCRLGVRRARGPVAGAVVSPRADRVGHHDAERERRGDDQRASRAARASDRPRSCCSRPRPTKS
jgi:PAS domain-containing protein